MLSNTEETIETGDLAVIAALDACEAGHPEAYKMLIGLPATMCIAGDRYPVTIEAVTPSLKTIKANGKTFRLDKRGSYVCSKHYFLHVGVAKSYWSPEV